MFIVKRINHLPGYDKLPSGEKIDKILGVVDNIFDAKELMEIIEHDLNNDDQFDEEFVAEDDADSCKVIVYSNFDESVVWFTIELEEVEYFDREYIESNKSRALDEADDNLAKAIGII